MLNILDTDGYKLTHKKLFPPGIQETTYYIESRGYNELEEAYLLPHNELVFFGLQMLLHNLTDKVTKEQVEEAKIFTDSYIGPNVFPYDDWMYIVNQLDGRIPLEISAPPEGEVIPLHNILVKLKSTDERCYWIPGWFETQLLRIWHPVTVATISYRIKKLLHNAYVKSSDNLDGLSWCVHGFGSRGSHASESAALADAAHLVNFNGTDTLVGVLAANKYYHSDMASHSVVAAEHSTITSWGQEREIDALRNVMNAYDTPIVSVISDSWSIDNAIDNIWGGVLKDEVIKSGKTVVIRLDSGKPIEGEVLRALQKLDAKFGSKINSKGFKVLNYVKVLQGDGVEEWSIKQIVETMLASGYAIDNLVLGMGGKMNACHNRDTYRFAMKCCLAKINDKYVHVFKDPATDPGKRSKSGDLDLVKFGHGYQTIDRLASQFDTAPKSELIPVYRNGEILKEWTLDEIRERVNQRIFGKELAHT